MKEFQISSGGGGKLACTQWEPEGTVKGVVQLIHGIAEYVQRYDELARLLAANGYVVVGEDHMGHGKSIKTTEKQGYFTGGWLTAVDDSYTLCKLMKKQYPDVPYFLYGHSMGSFMTRTLLYRYPKANFAGAIISGTGWQPKAVLRIGRLLCKQQMKKVGDKGCSPSIEKLMFGSYNKSFPEQRTAYDWLTTDKAVVDRYVEDPLCGFSATVGLADSMLSGLQLNEDRKNLDRMPKQLPVFLFSGDKDPVGAMGKGVLQTKKAFLKVGMENVTCKLYPGGRHEMHNESNKAEVYREVLSFLNANS